MIKFMLPGFYEHFQLFKTFISFKEKHPNYFYDNIEIGACYGNFQFCIWDGGRIFYQYKQANYENIIEIYNYFLSKNIPLRLVYTNTEITEEHLNDRFCNLVTELCEHENNEIVVNSPMLEQYLREKYPKYKIISSTTKCLTSPEDSQTEINKDYHMICLDYNLNHNFNFLNQITNKDKIEFLVNPICQAGCPYRKNHYRLNSIQHLTYNKTYLLNECRIKHNTLDHDSILQRNNISPEEIYTTYVPAGFTNFKLEGRTLTDLEVLMGVAKYMIKPEYQIQAIYDIYSIIHPERKRGK